MKKLWLLCAFSVGVCGAWDNFNQAYQAGLKAWKARNYDKTIEIQEQAAKLTQDPKLIFQAKINATYAAYRVRKYDVVEKLAKEILAVKGVTKAQQAQTLLQLGSVYQRQRKFDSAFEVYKKCLELQSTGWIYDSALLEISSLYYRQKNYKMAEESIQKIMVSPTATNSTKYFAQYRLFYFHLNKGNYAEAEKCINTIEKLAKAPRTPAVAAAVTEHFRGLILFRQNKFALATPMFVKCYQTKKCPPWLMREAQSYEALCYNKQGQYQKAQELLSKIKNPTPWIKRTIMRDAAKKTK